MTIAQQLSTARSFLFVPGARPDRFAKAAKSGADLVVLDLEDAVEADAKTVARANVHDWLADGHNAVVRINGHRSPYWADDVAMVKEFDKAAVMIPKAEDPDTVASVCADNAAIALVETAAGVLGASALSAVPGLMRTALGHIDLATELGVDPDAREALLFSRNMLMMAAAANNLASPVDGVTTSLRDAAALRSDLTYAKRLGFGGKLCVHPSQVQIVHDALRASPAELAWARSVLSSYSVNGAVGDVDGQMVDAPVLARAAQILGTSNEH